jgi:hypothetical protein
LYKKHDTKNAKGRNVMLQAKGLQGTIKRGAWREEIMENIYSLRYATVCDRSEW